MPEYHDRKSYTALHSLNNQETPNQMYKYQHAQLQYKSIHQDIPYIDFIDLNFKQTFNNRLNTFNFFSTNKYKKVYLRKRFKIINNKIEYDWFNGSFDSYKLKCRKIFLQNGLTMSYLHW